MHFTEQTSSNGVLERDFTLGDFSGVLWSPLPAPGRAPVSGVERAPLVLLGHGGGNHRSSPAMSGRARLLSTIGGFHVATIDAPAHGDRPVTEYDEQEVALMQQKMALGEPVGEIVVRYNLYLAEQAVPEWQATLDALQELPEIGPDGPVGYFGLNLGTAIGIPLAAADPRITAAVFGIFWPDPLAETAKQITIPIEFDLQWDDQYIDRAAGLRLFDAFASTDKTLHANAGGQKELPRFEADSAVHFFMRHLKSAA